jgi:hypothetical protein
VQDNKYQSEIEDIFEKSAKFQPSQLAIEIDPKNQSKIDSLYNEYLLGNYQLKRSETDQLGFRLAKRFGHE